MLSCLRNKKRLQLDERTLRVVVLVLNIDILFLHLLVGVLEAIICGL